MKFLILVCALITCLVYAQEDVVYPEPTSVSKAYNGNEHTAASTVDINGAYENQVNDFHNIPVDKSCPGCNIHGSLSYVDENGKTQTIKDGSGNPAKSGGDSEAGQGP